MYVCLLCVCACVWVWVCGCACCACVHVFVGEGPVSAHKTQCHHHFTAAAVARQPAEVRVRYTASSPPRNTSGAHPAPPCAGSPCSTLCWLTLLRPVLAHPAPPCAGSPCSTLCWLTLLHPVLAHPAPPCAGSPCSTLCWLPLLRPVLAHPAPPPGPPRTAGGDPDVGPRRVQQLTPHCGPGAYFSPSACPPLTWPALGGSSPWGI